MNLHDYELVKNYDYSTYCKHLLEKYGAVGGDYFTPTFSQNMTIKRADERLYIHHIDEDKVANLSNYDVAKTNSFDYQRAERLVYADLFEHILLHILIGEQNNGLGFGGAEKMFAYANDKIWEDADVLDILKERCRNSINAYETLLTHNQTVFYELIDTLDKHDLAFLDLGPGLGKTTTALACIRKYGVKALVLGPTGVITKGWDGEEDVEPYTYAWFMNNYKNIDYAKYGMLICDEAHHLSGKRWREGVEYVKQNKLLKIIGLTGTPNKACRDFFENRECKGFSVLDGIEREIIHDFSYVGAIYDTSDIKEKYADISDKTLLGELDLALNNTPTVKTIITKHMPNNKRKGIIFVSNIDAMGEAEEIMRDIYPNAEYRRMHSRMPYDEVKETREWFQNTDEGYLLAVNMISEGAHYKGVNTIIMFRRTQSSLVFNQQLGRIITLARDEDPHAIVFDLVNNAENLDTEKGFSASLRESYAQRKARGGKEKSEQIIVEDYAETISDVLRKILELNTRDYWTEEEEALLITLYEELGPAATAELLGRGKDAVRCKANKLGLYSQFTAVLCLNDKCQIEKKYPKLSLVEEDGYSRGAVLQCCQRKMTKSGGKYWCFEKDYSEEWRPWQGKFSRNEPVYCVELNKVFENAKLASAETGANYGHLLHCCNGLPQYKTVGGYHWCFAKDKDTYVIPVDNACKRRVRCKNTGIIYDSIAEASRQTGAPRSGISAVLSGRQKTSGQMSDGTRLEWEYVE